MRKSGEALRWIGVAWHLAAVLALPVAAEEAKGDLIWGVNGHPLASYPGVSIERQLDYVKELGMTSYRIDVVRTDQPRDLRAGSSRQSPRHRDPPRSYARIEPRQGEGG